MNLLSTAALKLFSTLTAICLLSGCASMLNGDHQIVTVKTEQDTEIFVDGVYAGKGYTKLKLPRDVQHEVRVSKEGCEDATLVTQPNFNETSLLGVFVDFGLVSIPTDFMTGAAWDIEPSDMTLAANCNG